MKQGDAEKLGEAWEKSPYDRGLMNNLKDALGSPYSLFLWGPVGNGVEFEKSYSLDDRKTITNHYIIDDTMII
jgi:palmitoyltransferase